MACELVNSEYIANVTCYLKPTRDGNGRFTGALTTIKNMTDFWVEVRVYYRNSALRLIPFFQTFDFDLCGLMDGTSSIVFFVEFFIKEINKQFPNFLHRCPYVGKYEFKNINFSEMLENAIINLVPKATYKVVVRFYAKKSNMTYFQFYGLGDVTAVNVLHEFGWIQAGRTVYN